MSKTTKEIIKHHNYDKSRLMDILLDIRQENGSISDEVVAELSAELEMSKISIEEIISFYHFLPRSSSGKYNVYLNNSVPSVMAGFSTVKKTFEEAVGCKFGQISADKKIGLFETACIGMNDQEPAAIINNIVFTNLTPKRVNELVADMKAGKTVKDMIKEDFGDGQNNSTYLKTMVCNNIQRKGHLLNDDYESGIAIQKIVTRSPKQIINVIKASQIAGRGGAGFPTGLKWEFCSRIPDDEKFIICNADEGEPGTFKDRVLLTEKPLLLFEGMAIAGYAVGAKTGIVYVRDEYKYLNKYLEKKLEEAYRKRIIGKDLGGKKGFDFDIRLQYGAGSYVCGEESALIESAEGKRGEPRDRPPFPIQEGYLNKPTVVNNVETLCAVCRIIEKGSKWYLALGTERSKGTKLLSVSGDCERPGIYEIEWGMTINEMLEVVGAADVQAVQISGPSGVLIDPKQFNRKLCYADLGTGGSTIIFNQSRNLLRDVVHNFMEFFMDESCGSCSTCRIVPAQLNQKLEKILAGNGVFKDIEDMIEWAKILDSSRCGLGKTAANPITSSIANFRHLYDDLIQKDKVFDEGFNLEKAIQESCEVVNRVPK